MTKKDKRYTAEDFIFLKMSTQMFLGIHPVEREQKQQVRIKIQAYTRSFYHTAKTESLQEGVDYFQLAKLIKQICQHSYSLVETLAEDIADQCFSHFDSIYKLVIEIEKPEAIPFLETVGIHLVRYRPSFSSYSSETSHVSQ